MTTEQLAFVGISGALVLGIVMFWVPYRVGRSPLALYDQCSAISILAAALVSSVAATGWSLWAGVIGVMAGIATHALVSFLTTDELAERSALVFGLFYLGSFALFAICTFLVATLARSFLAA